MKINSKVLVGLTVVAIGAAAFASVGGVANMPFFGSVEPTTERKVARQMEGIPEGPAIACEIEVGPFDIHRKYRSMEGPWAVAKFKIGDLIAAGSGNLPEARVHFVEKEEGGAAPSMKGGDSYVAPSSETLLGVTPQNDDKSTLYWFKGLKLEVLDENGQTLPTAEFICHTNLDFSFGEHNASFKDGQRWNSDRLITITQGQTNIVFPVGFAVPLASDESFRVTFQAANRTTSAHRRVKHKATFYFIKDSDLVYPVTALYSRVPFAQVVVDRNYSKSDNKHSKQHPTCDVQTFAVNAPNNVVGGVITDRQGRVTSGHWVVPPGIHTYKSTINDLDPTFSQDERKMRFAWSHIHPCCTDVSVTKCDGVSKQKMFTAKVKTKTDPGLELVDIQLVKPQEAIVFPRNSRYEVEGTYNNTLNVPLDSMISVGMFFEDTDFRRPLWSLPDSKAAFCGVVCKKDESKTTPAYPLFDLAKDGPALIATKKVALSTNKGIVKLYLEPSLAPCAATQLYRVMTEGGFDGTRFAASEPNFLLQIAAAEDKLPGKNALPNQLRAKLRNLPLEAFGKHNRYTISVARRAEDNNSGSTSICLMLAPAHHLDGKYTVVGHVGEDAQTLKTINALCKQWQSAEILSARAY